MDVLKYTMRLSMSDEEEETLKKESYEHTHFFIQDSF